MASSSARGSPHRRRRRTATRANACPYLRCRYHLGEPGRNGCALDVAEQEPTSSDKTTHHTLDHVGAQLDVSRERTRQIEERALEKAGPLVELLAARKRKAAG